VLGLIKRSVMRGADQQMIDDVMQSPLLNVVISRHMRDMAKDTGGGSSDMYRDGNPGEFVNAEIQRSHEWPALVPAAAAPPPPPQQQRHQSVCCSTSPCPSCTPLVHQLRRQVADLQAAAAAAAILSAPFQQRLSHIHSAASCCPPPLNSSNMTIRCIDGRTVQV
jgi:hypothetical protein